MDIYGEKSQLEYSQHLMGLFHRLTLSAEWVFLQIKADRRRGKEKTRDCKEEVAGSTPVPEPGSPPLLHVLQPSVVSEGMHTWERDIPKPWQESPLWHHSQTRCWPEEPHSSSQRCANHSRNPHSSPCDLGNLGI